MLNSNMVKFGFIAAMFAFASCHNDVPELPSEGEIQGYEFCKYVNAKDSTTHITQCKSTYEISKITASFAGLCTNLGGETFPDKTSCCTACREEELCGESCGISAD